MRSKSQILAQQLQGYIREQQERRDALHLDRTTLVGERDALLSAPLGKDDVKQFIFDYIDARAAEYPKLADWAGLLDSVAYPRRYMWHSNLRTETGKPAPLCLRDVDAAVRGTPSEHLATFEDGLRFFGAGHQINLRSDLAAYFFFGDLIKNRIAENFDAFFGGYHSADACRIGPPIAERRTALAEIDRRLGEIDAEIASIDSDVRQLSATARIDRVGVKPSDNTTQARATRSAIEKNHDLDIYREFNGRNAEALAQKYGVPAQKVLAIGSRGLAPD